MHPNNTKDMLLTRFLENLWGERYHSSFLLGHCLYGENVCIGYSKTGFKRIVSTARKFAQRPIRGAAGSESTMEANQWRIVNSTDNRHTKWKKQPQVFSIANSTENRYSKCTTEGNSILSHGWLFHIKFVIKAESFILVWLVRYLPDRSLTWKVLLD